jgi:hypothetical protein
MVLRDMTFGTTHGAQSAARTCAQSAAFES